MSKIKVDPMAASRNILVPTDFSSVSKTAINHACYLAHIFKKEITLLHVVESGLFSSEKKMGEKEKDFLGQLQAIAAKVKAEENLEIVCMTRRGNIFDTIGEVAEELDASLVIMGTHGVRGFQHIFGSRALRVITNANRPFVVVQDKQIRSRGYQNIVLPIDFSRETKQKLVWAAELAKKFNSTLHILADYETDEFIVKAVNNNIHFAEHYLSERNIQFTVEKAEKGENLAKATIHYAASLDADLIIIMTDPDLNLGDYIVGPDEQKIISNQAQIPVMTINEVDLMQLKTAAMFH